ncbi:alanine racemase [Ovoidimarina sediminis]|uniref:alanine racemase n=1 Tax=Ovoidimarina sediminis TaxID=3079856 RepID=UPI00290CCF3B|nr:alanine racemase [Rhodophyticola sp. MJ-SS7]MDU8945316.1 alanine racemase [Rhodophyticola sp. MJ-SS7]
MGTGRLTIDLDAITANWWTLDARAGGRAGAVVKADAYGLGAEKVAPVLRRAGADAFFVAVAEEGGALRRALGPGPEIYVFAGHMAGDHDMIRDLDLIPMLNSGAQVKRHVSGMADRPFAVQLDTGMNRLGMEPAEWAALRDDLLARNPRLIASHLACADEPDHPMNARQLDAFRGMTEGVEAPLSLAATGGTLLGEAFHFHRTRPGVGLYGGEPFAAAEPVVTLDLPVIQVREVAAGETVGYGNTWAATRPVRIATLAAGYADGLIRAMGGRARLWHDGRPCPLAGRVSMDLLTVDITGLDETPDTLQLLSREQTVDHLAHAAGTIGYEILTSLGSRYERRYVGGAP